MNEAWLEDAGPGGGAPRMQAFFRKLFSEGRETRFEDRDLDALRKESESIRAENRLMIGLRK